MFAIRNPRSCLPATFLGVAAASLLLAACGGGRPKPADSVTSSPPATSAPAPTTSTPSTGTLTPSAPPSSGTPSSGTPSSGASPSSASSSGSATTTKVVSYRVSYGWNWPAAPTAPGVVKHTAKVPAPQLVRIGAGRHPNDPGEYGFERISFTFTTGFPSYRFTFTDKLVADPSGRSVPILSPTGPLAIVFGNAQAHTSTLPVRSSIVAQPARPLGLHRLVDYAPAGDFEGVLSYGLGMSLDVPHSHPHYMIRVSELETVSSTGVHRYVVAFDVQLGLVPRH